MSEITRIRRARLDDAVAVLPLLEQLGYPSTESQVRKRFAAILSRPDYNTWIAEQGGRAVGLAGARLGYAYERDGSFGQWSPLWLTRGFVGAV